MAREIQADELHSKMASAKALNHGRPDVLVSVRPYGDGMARLTEEEMDQYRIAIEEEHRGVSKAGKMMLLGDDFKAQILSTSLADMEHVKVRQAVRDMIIQVGGLSPEMCGVLDNSNKSTIDAAATLTYDNTTHPRLCMIRDVLQTQLCNEIDPGFRLGFRSMRPVDREAVQSTLIARPDLFSLRQAQQALGLGPLRDGEALLSAPSDNSMETRVMLEVAAQVRSGVIPKESAIALLSSMLVSTEEATAFIAPIEIHKTPENMNAQNVNA
jgi:hypothetical protein